MAKSKKKKHQYKDFQKVKLKVGKTLAKANNVTDTFFKTRSIQIREQVSKSVDFQPTTKRKLNIAELFSRCDHYNTTVKQDALTGLHQLLSAYPELTHSHLSPLLSCLAHIFIDKDAAVRASVHRLLRLILPRVPSAQIQPFFFLLTAHLCCAMTHICDDVQVDSLAVLDLLLQFYPTLVTTATDQLLPIFIDQISRQGQSSQSGHTRSLLVNPNSRLSSHKWRSKVLDRLHRFLQAMLDNQVMERDGGELGSTVIVRDTTWHFQPYGSDAVGSNLGKSFRLSSQSSVTETDVLSSRERLQSFMDTLVPLLLQCWVEVAPDLHGSTVSDSTLSVNAETTLASVLNVLKLLLQCMTRADSNHSSSVNWMREKYLKDFMHYFLLHFPYSVHDQPQGKKAAKQSKPCVLSLNLTLVEVMGHFLLDPEGHVTKAGWTQVIFDYVVSQLTVGRRSKGSVPILLSTARRMLRLPLPLDWQEQLLDAVLTQHNACAASHSLPHIQLYLDVVTSQSHLTSTAAMSKCLGMLPGLLLEANTEHEALMSSMVTLMTVAASQGYQSLLSALAHHMTGLLEATFVQALKPDVQHKLVELVFYSPTLERCHFTQLSLLCQRHVMCDSAVTYLLEVLHHRSTRDTETHDDGGFSLADYISFLLSTTLGTTHTELFVARQSSGKFQADMMRVIQSSHREWLRDMKLSQVTRHFILQLPSPRQLLNVVQNVIEDLLRHRVLPVHSGVSVIQLVSDLHRNVHSDHAIVHSDHSDHSDRITTDCLLTESLMSHITTPMLQLLLFVGNKSHIDVSTSSSMDDTQSADSVDKTNQTGSDATEVIDGTMSTHTNNSVADEAGMTAEMIDDVCTCVYESCTELLYSSTDVYSTFLLQTTHMLEDCSSTADIKMCVDFLTRLLFVKKLRSHTKQHRSALTAMVSIVERKTLEGSQERWLAAFKYELSLLKH